MRKWSLVAGLFVASWGTASAHPGVHEQIEDLEARIAAAPRDTDLRLRHAELLLRAGHLRDALTELAAVARLDPDDPEVLWLRAQVRVAQGRSRQAERDLDRVLAVRPSHAGALAERAKLHEAAGRLDAARADLDAAVAVRGSPDLYLARGRIDERRGRLDDAAQGYREGLQALGPTITLELALIDVQCRRDEPERALVLVDALLARSPARADWILRRAEVLDAIGLSAAATVERLRALVVAEDNLRRRPTPLHRLILAEAHLALELRDLAREHLDLVLAEAPDLPAALELRARLNEPPRSHDAR